MKWEKKGVNKNLAEAELQALDPAYRPVLSVDNRQILASTTHDGRWEKYAEGRMQSWIGGISVPSEQEFSDACERLGKYFSDRPVLLKCISDTHILMIHDLQPLLSNDTWILAAIYVDDGDMTSPAAAIFEEIQWWFVCLTQCNEDPRQSSDTGI